MKNLKLLREERGLSQQKLGDIFLISQQSIYKYENGLAEPSLELLINFANFFNTSIDYLVGNSDDGKLIEFDNLTERENKHLAYYRQLNTASKEQLDNFLEAMINENHYNKKRENY